MKFDAGKEIEPLEYDFSTIPGLDPEIAAVLNDAKGIVPEPSQDTLERFQTALRETVISNNLEGIASLGEDPPAHELIAVMESLPEGALHEAMRGTNDAVADLCAGSPTREQLDALPARHRLGFIGYLTGALVRPTRPTSASTPSLAGANGAGPTA